MNTKKAVISHFLIYPGRKVSTLASHEAGEIRQGRDVFMKKLRLIRIKYVVTKKQTNTVN